MSKEETIKNLKKLKSFHNGSYGTAIAEAIKALEQEPCEDAVSRQAVIDAIDNIDWYHISNKGELVQGANKQTMPLYKAADIFYAIDALPSVTPKYTDEEIQKMQELEQAQLEKAYELGMQTSFEDWLSTFNTDSATECFTAVQELKKRLEVNI